MTTRRSCRSGEVPPIGQNVITLRPEPPLNVLAGTEETPNPGANRGLGPARPARPSTPPSGDTFSGEGAVRTGSAVRRGRPLADLGREEPRQTPAAVRAEHDGVGLAVVCRLHDPHRDASIRRHAHRAAGTHTGVGQLLHRAVTSSAASCRERSVRPLPPTSLSLTWSTCTARARPARQGRGEDCRDLARGRVVEGEKDSVEHGLRSGPGPPAACFRNVNAAGTACRGCATPCRLGCMANCLVVQPVAPRAAWAMARDLEPCLRIGTAAWGLQFRLEVTCVAVDGFLCGFAADAARVPGSAGHAIRRGNRTVARNPHPWHDPVLDRFAALVAAGSTRRTRWISAPFREYF